MHKLGIPARMKMMTLIQEGYGRASRVGKFSYLREESLIQVVQEVFLPLVSVIPQNLTASWSHTK